MMNKDDILKILNEIKDTNDMLSLRIDDNLIEKGFDSMDIIKLIVYLEENFCIEIDEDDLLIDKFNSIRKISLMIEKYKVDEKL